MGVLLLHAVFCPTDLVGIAVHVLAVDAVGGFHDFIDGRAHTGRKACGQWLVCEGDERFDFFGAVRGEEDGEAEDLS